MAYVRFAFVFIALLCTVLLSGSSNCTDGCSMLPIHHAKFVLSYNCSEWCRIECASIERGHVTLLKDDKGNVSMNFSWVMFSGRPSEIVEEVLVKESKFDPNGKYCIPMIKALGCQVFGLRLRQEYFVKFGFGGGRGQACTTSQLPLGVILPSNTTSSSAPLSTDSAENTDTYAHTPTKPSVIKSSVVPSTESTTTLPGMLPSGSVIVDTPARSTAINLSVVPTDSPTTIQVSGSHSSRVGVVEVVVISIVGSVLSLALAVTAVFMFIRHHMKTSSSGSDSSYLPSLSQCPAPDPLTDTDEENCDIKKSMLVVQGKLPRKVWLSFPTQQPTTRRAAQNLAEELNAAGVECMCALLCQTDIATNTYERVDILMKSTDVILCCCNEDFHSSWMKGNSIGLDSDPDYIFYRECLHISYELKNQQYRRLAIVLLEGSLPCCIPDCLQATPHFRFPCERGLFDLIYRIYGSEPNRLVNAHSPTQTESTLYHCVAAAEEKETEV